MADFGEKKSLGEICEVFIGRSPISVSSEKVKKKQTPSKGPLCITGAQVTESGFLELSRAKSFPGRACKQDFLREGDLCFGAVFGRKKLRVAQITGEQAQKNFVASHSLVVIRPPESFSDAERRFLLAYLRSKRAANFLALKSPLISFDLMAVKTLPVPRPDEELQHQITELLEAAQNFDRLRADADSALDDLFDFESVDDARLHILSTGRRTKVCSEAASAATKFENLVRTQFPHPLALRWRRVEASKDDLAGYIEILQCGETLLCYLASLCVVTARESGKAIQAVGNLSDKLTKRSGGVSLGDWIAILRETNTSKSFRDSQVSSLLYEITNFIVPETDRAIQRLSELRNDQAHGRGPTASDLSVLCLEAKALLETLFKAASFLTDYPLIFIEETARDSLEGITKYKYRKLVGDHHLVPLEEAQHDSCEIDKGALYLIDKRGDLVGLRPMVIRQACPECGTWATFHLENFHKKKGLFEIKAFEHGHTTEYPSSRHFELFGFGG